MFGFTDATAGSLTGPWIGLANFRHELRDPIFVDAIWHTFLFTAISQAVVIVCAGLLAHALVRSFRGRWLLRFFILLPWAARAVAATARRDRDAENVRERRGTGGRNRVPLPARDRRGQRFDAAVVA